MSISYLPVIGDWQASQVVTCMTCCALVQNFPSDRERHAEWHQTLIGWQNAVDKRLDPAPFPFQCSICFGPVDADGETCGTCADLANEGVL